MPGPASRIPALRHVFAVPLLLSALAAHADYRYLETQPSATMSPLRFAPDGRGGFWTVDDYGVHRIDAAGRRDTALRSGMLKETWVPSYTDLAATGDGGAIAFNRTQCEAARISADGRATWRQRIAENCTDFAVSAGAVTWVGGDLPGDRGNLFRIAPDGRVQRWRLGNAPVAAFDVAAEVKVQADESVFVLSRGVAEAKDVLRRYDARGGEQWRWEGATRAAQTVEPDGSGGAYVAGIDAGNITVTHIDARGQVLSAQRSAAGDADVLALYRADNGAAYAVTGSRGEALQYRPVSLLRIGTDGRVAWTQPYCPTAVPALAGLQLAVDRNGTVAALCDAMDLKTLQRTDRSGAQVSSVALPFAFGSQLRQSGDDTLLVLGHGGTSYPYRTRVIAIDAGDRIQPTAFDAPQDAAALRLLAATSGSEGETYLVAQDYGFGNRPTPQFISRVDADGSSRWRVQLPTEQLRVVRITAGHGLVCLHEQGGNTPVVFGSDEERAFCLRASDGSLFKTLFDISPGGLDVVLLQPLAGERVAMLRNTVDQHVLEIHTATAQQRRTVGNGKFRAGLIDPSGRTSVETLQGRIQYAPDGSVAYNVVSPAAGEFAPQLFDAGGGKLLVAGSNAQPHGLPSFVWLLDASGNVGWRRQQIQSARVVQVQASGDSVFVVQSGPTGPSTLMDTWVSRHALADGDQLWQFHSQNANLGALPYGKPLAYDAARDEAVLLHGAGNRLRLERIGSDGLRREERWIACGGRCDQPLSVGLRSNGAAQIAASVLDERAGPSPAVFGVTQATVAAASTRVDQPGVAGLWYSPYANGEGLSIDWLPASRTLFAAWFTYTANALDDPREQRWYTLQVNGVPAGARQLELPILETVRGNFNAGPAVMPSPQPAGTATLRFSDCHNASLEYRFFNGFNNAAQGTVTLSRLTPATQDCTLADGSTQPGSGVRPPAGGFDARLSGAWYSEASVGQGLQLNIQPGGVLFAPWFTFDPAGQHDDLTGQHWFTLQADLAQASNGSVEAKLIQTMGGAFDRTPTYNANVVGSATLRVQGCDRAQLDYRFDDNETAGSYAGRSGRIELQRMGGCAP